MKALGQNGLNFIANKYKELKKLIGDKADKSEIITQEERQELDFVMNDYHRVSLNALEAKLNLGAEAVKAYPDRDDTLPLFFYVYDWIDGNITVPDGIDFPNCYAYQLWNIKKSNPTSYALCGASYSPIGLPVIEKAKKADNNEVLISDMVNMVFDTAYTKARTLHSTDQYFVKKEKNKGLSTNDYDNTARALVEAIPVNPKYTDTVVDVVDNLTTSDATKALSAKQGKALQDNKADKSNISRCKAKGYDTSNTWQPLSTERDLEDWIGDFDKRTRELKDSGGGELKTWFFGQDLQCVATKLGKLVVIYVNGQDFYNWGRQPTLPSAFIPAFDYFRNASSLSSGDKEIAFNCGSGTYISILSSGTIRLLSYGDSSKRNAFAANIVYFTD